MNMRSHQTVPFNIKNEEFYQSWGANEKNEICPGKRRIRKLGNVNVNAIEEYKEISERHTFLSAQYEDLKTAEAQAGKYHQRAGRTGTVYHDTD